MTAQRLLDEDDRRGNRLSREGEGPTNEERGRYGSPGERQRRRNDVTVEVQEPRGVKFEWQYPLRNGWHAVLESGCP